jgi:hypothetical protein
MELKLAVKGLVMLILQGLVFNYSGESGCCNHCLMYRVDSFRRNFSDLLSYINY